MEEHNGEAAQANTEATSAENEARDFQAEKAALVSDLSQLVERMTAEGRDQSFWRDELQSLIVVHTG